MVENSRNNRTQNNAQDQTDYRIFLCNFNLPNLILFYKDFDIVLTFLRYIIQFIFACSFD